MNTTLRGKNLIFILTDDQGLGDFGWAGNRWIRTPHIDALHARSFSFTDFHVHPVCTPTRGAFLTGCYPAVNGARSTLCGMELLGEDVPTMAEIFQENGYRTGIFGKWHLGDSAPSRPHDRGFERAIWHKGGGVGQTPDYWGNCYFNDTYFHDDTPRSHVGYCTDIWFDEACNFMAEDDARPFFAYIATNAPHAPWLVDERYAKPYRNNPEIPHAEFYGMVENIDENMGKLLAWLEETGLAKDTVLVFSTDNGTDGGYEENPPCGFNAGMRGKKMSLYDGGHRVPLLLHLPEQEEHVDVTGLSADIDLLPTLVDLFALSTTASFDGVSCEAALTEAFCPAGRPHVIQYHRYRHYKDGCDPIPPKEDCVVLQDQWRLVELSELYDMNRDPGQENNCAQAHPEIVKELLAAHEEWWGRMLPYWQNIPRFLLGSDRENPVCLNSFDVMGDIAWQQAHVVAASAHAGRWAVQFDQPGEYRFSLRRWPEELGLAIGETVSDDDAKKLVYPSDSTRSVSIAPDRARLRVFDHDPVLPVDIHAQDVAFQCTIDQAQQGTLEARFETEAGESWGAYYLYVERLVV